MDVELRRLLQETLPLFYPEHRQVKLSINLTGLKNLASLEQACAVLLYRFVHGAMTNIYRHARAKHAKVEAIHTEKDLIVRVCDDGVGFNPSLIEGFINNGHFFFHDIAIRARQLEGNLQINSNDQGGTCLEVTVPLSRCARQEGH
jgi:signal transduction histidine kinase